MKKIIFATAIAVMGFINSQAQLSFSLNLGTQPAWGTTGYDRADYYYIPDIDAYYDISRRMYVYRNGRRWITARSLPPRYRNADLYHMHKVVINNDRDPWMHHDRYYKEYHGYAGRRDQEAIRDSRDRKYWQNPGNMHHREWQHEHGNHRYDNDMHNNNNHRYDNRGNGYGHDNDHGHGRH